MRRGLKTETTFYGAAKYGTILITLLTAAVLARVLTPADYGVVTVVTVFTALFSVLSDMGLGAAIIQKKDLSDEQTNDIFSFSVYCAMLMALVFFLLGFPIAAFYRQRVYQRICAILSVSVFFNAVNIIPNSLMLKRKRFALVGMRLIVTALLAGIFAVVLALSGASFYTLVFQSVFQSVAIFLWNFWGSGLKFRLRFQMRSVQMVRQFSAYQFSFSIINYFARNLDNLLIGKVMGDESLGYYDKGYRLMMYPIQNLTYVINPIIHPILSDYQNEKRIIYDSYMKIARVLSLLGVVISAGCFSCSREIILLFFGRQWEASIPVFQLLCISVWPQMVSSSAGSIYQSMGNTKLMFQSGMIHFGVSILCIIVGVISKNLQTLALLVSVGLYLRFFIDYYFLIKKCFSFSYRAFLNAFRNDLLIALALAAAVILLANIDLPGLIWNLLAKGSAICLLFFVMLLLTKEWGKLVSLIRSWKT